MGNGNHQSDSDIVISKPPVYPTLGDTSFAFEPNGRFGRLSWLAWNLVLGLVAAAITVVFAYVEAKNPNASAALKGLGVMAALGAAYLFLMFSIRRLHDIDSSGWWSLIFFSPPANFIMWLALAIMRGDAECDKFGPERPTRRWERALGIIVIVMLTGLPSLGLVIYLILLSTANFSWLDGR
jgi:uncharacterized membrane protein YhaH (DUF805 family)